MSKWQFRATSPADEDAVSSFLQRIWGRGPQEPGLEPRHLHWKNWLERPDWSGSRGYILTSQDEIVAHGTAVPLSFTAGGERYTIVHLIDWAAEPKSSGSGVALLKRMSQSADAMLTVGGSEMTQKILPALGFKVRGRAQRFVRPLRPLRRLTGQKLSARLGAQFARSLAWTWQAPRAQVDGWTMRRVTAEELVSQAIPWPKSSAGSMLFERTPALMAYYLRCPAARLEMHVVSKGGSTLGYFVLAFAPAQARIVDLWVDSADRGDWCALVQLAVQQACQDQQVAEVISMASDPAGSQAFLDAGFHPRGTDALFLLASNRRELPEVPITFRMLDGDAAYLRTGSPEFWA